jgi:hypothetical protein
MICSRCRTPTVTWRGPITGLTHTECSKCGGANCQEPEIEACEHCGSVADQCDWQITNDNHGGNAPCGIQWSEVIE